MLAPSGLSPTVSSIDSILVGTSYRKRFNYFTFYNCFPSIIEGIGGTNGFIYPFDNGMDNGSKLNCFIENNTILYNSSCPFNYSPPCNSLITSINFPNNSKKITVRIFPNPVHENLTILTKTISLPFKISIYNIVGIKVMEKETNYEHTDLNMSILVKGMYFVKIENNKMVLLNEKIILK